MSSGIPVNQAHEPTQEYRDTLNNLFQDGVLTMTAGDMFRAFIENMAEEWKHTEPLETKNTIYVVCHSRTLDDPLLQATVDESWLRTGIHTEMILEDEDDNDVNVYVLCALEFYQGPVLMQYLPSRIDRAIMHAIEAEATRKGFGDNYLINTVYVREPRATSMRFWQ